MKTRTGMAILVATALGGWAWAELDNTNQPPRLEIELVDGSRIIGTPSIHIATLQTSYAKMDVPLKQILTIKMGEDRETVSLALRNGDTVNGVITLTPIKLQTVFGSVVIGIEHVREIAVVLSGGALPELLKKGLVLHYSFNAIQEGVVKDASDCKNHSAAVQGVTVDGKASFRGSSSILVPNSASLNPEKSITLSVWIKATTHENKGIVMKGPLTHSQGSYSLVLNPASHGGNGLFRLNGGTEDGRGQVSTRESMAGHMGKWTHLVGTYSDGEQKIYLNGMLSGTQPYQQPIQNDANAMVVGGYYSPDYLYQGDLDDLMIFNRALAADEVKLLYGTGKRKE